MTKAIRITFEIDNRWLGLVLVDPPFVYLAEDSEERQYLNLTDEMKDAFEELKMMLPVLLPMMEEAQHHGVLKKAVSSVFARELNGKYLVAKDGTKMGPITSADMDFVNVE